MFGFLAQGRAMSTQGQRIVILGAGPAIAEATARIWAGEGARLILVGRDGARLENIAADLKTRGTGDATPWPLDCANADAAAQLDKMVEALGGLDVLLLAYGVFGDQAELERDPSAVAKLIETNFTSAVAWCLAATAILERQCAGALLVIGSVAGDRGRDQFHPWRHQGRSRPARRESPRSQRRSALARSWSSRASSIRQ